MLLIAFEYSSVPARAISKTVWIETGHSAKSDLNKLPRAGHTYSHTSPDLTYTWSV